jgi:3-oxoacyl-[acyl-carrier protein] reductase
MNGFLQNQTVVISGGAAGIGFAISNRLHELGANIAVISRSQSNLNNLATSLGNERVFTFEGDCGEPIQVENFVSQAYSRFGQFSIVVSNAGIGSFGSVRSIKLDRVEEMLRTNLLGSINLVKCSLPYMEQDAQKDIVMISSSAGFRGGANEAAYAATKHGQIGFATALDRELRSEGFRVTVIAPGTTETGFGVGHGRSAAGAKVGNFLSADDVARQVVHVVTQPPHMRIPLLTILAMDQGL